MLTADQKILAIAVELIAGVSEQTMKRPKLRGSSTYVWHQTLVELAEAIEANYPGVIANVRNGTTRPVHNG